MRVLTLVRHARAVAANDTAHDFDRVLTAQGEAEAEAAAERLAQLGHRPGLIVTSPARRAARTAELLARALDEPAQLVEEPRLYLASARVWLEVLNALAGHTQVTMVGHNPGITAFARHLGQKPQLHELATSAALRLEFEVPGWDAIGFDGPPPSSIAFL